MLENFYLFVMEWAMNCYFLERQSSWWSWRKCKWSWHDKTHIWRN